MSDKIKSDPEELRDRLNQRRMTRFEMLRQVRGDGPLSANAEREFQKLLQQNQESTVAKSGLSVG
jgi:hypothetical protein